MLARVDGAALRRARLALGMTQTELAQALGVAGAPRISSWEHGTNQPQVSQIPALARILRVSPESLLVGDVGNRLRELRWAAGLSLDEMADRLHVSRNHYQRWETGERPFPTRAAVLRQLSESLAVPESVVRQAVASIDSPPGVSAEVEPNQGTGTEEHETGSVDDEDSDGIPGLADKLNHLFATVPRSAGSDRPHVNVTAAEALQQYGIRVTSTHLSHLRAGRRDNPSARLLAGLAKLFGVPLGYFFEEDLEREVNQELAALVAAREARLQTLMMRGVSRDSLEQVEGILEQIRRLEGLEVVDEADNPPR